MVLCFRDLYLAGLDVVAGRFAGTDFFRITALVFFAVAAPAWLLARRHYSRMYSYSSAGEILFTAFYSFFLFLGLICLLPALIPER